MISVIVLAVLALAFVLWRAVAPTQEFARPTIDVGDQPLPGYIQNMEPGMRKMAEEQWKAEQKRSRGAKPKGTYNPPVGKS